MVGIRVEDRDVGDPGESSAGAGTEAGLSSPLSFGESADSERSLSTSAPAEPRLEIGPVELTAREFALLETFLRHPDQVLSREQVLAQVWGYDSYPGSNVVEVYVRALRRKLKEGVIETVRGWATAFLAPI